MSGAAIEDFLHFLIDLDLVDGGFITEVLASFITDNNMATVIRLIELGADPSNSRILFAAAVNQPELLKILLEYIPRQKWKPKPGLGTAAVKRSIELGLAGLRPLKDLLKSDVVDFHSFRCDDPYRTVNPHESPLGMAIRHAVEYEGTFPVVKCLLDAGCDPNGVVCTERSFVRFNFTALLAAIETKSINLVKFLLTCGAEINTTTTRGLTRTPLQLAAELGCLEIVQLLIKEGANVNAAPAQRGGGTALQLAAISGNCNIVAALLSHDADPRMSPSGVHGRWPIEGAAEHGRLDMIDYLLKVTPYDAEQCKRAMEFAKNRGHMGCRDFIQDYVNQQESMLQYLASSSYEPMDEMELGLY